MAWGTGSPMPDGVRAADALDGPEPEVTSAEHRLLRRVRLNLSLWSGGITLAVLIVLGIVLFVAVEQSLAASGTDQLEARADQVTRQRPDPDDLPQAGINFGGVGSGTLLVLATEDGQPIVLPGPNRDGPPPGLPLMEGIDAVKAGVERDIRTASITTTDGTRPSRHRSASSPKAPRCRASRSSSRSSATAPPRSGPCRCSSSS